MPWAFWKREACSVRGSRRSTVSRACSAWRAWSKQRVREESTAGIRQRPFWVRCRQRGDSGAELEVTGCGFILVPRWRGCTSLCGN